MKKVLVPLVFLLLLLSNCARVGDAVSVKDAFWLDSLIAKMQSDPVGSPPLSISQYEYKGKIVYYIPPQCCDQFSVLYDAGGNVIGFPDGGITGTGDGQYPDFFTVRTNEKLIWKDSRTRNGNE